MRALGLTIFLLGFFASAFVTVRFPDSAGKEWQTIEWGWYALSFSVGVVGVVLLRLSARAASGEERKIDADIVTMTDSLGKIRRKLEEANANWDPMRVYDVHFWIDAELADDLGRFADVRESVARRYGLQKYADLMSQFAMGERNINRAWSASADGYVNETAVCLQRAESLVSEADSLLRKIQEEGQLS
ncbi:MAG: hypothetical protein ACPGXK_14860 [Phycisphaerae bacterium]